MFVSETLVGGKPNIPLGSACTVEVVESLMVNSDWLEVAALIIVVTVSVANTDVLVTGATAALFAIVGNL